MQTSKLLLLVVGATAWFGCQAEESVVVDIGSEVGVLTMCVQLGKTKEVDALLRGGISGVGTESPQNLPMYFSILGDRPDCLYLLLNSGVDPRYTWPGKDGGFPLAVAAQYGRVRCVELLLNFGADARQVDARGHTALYRAVIAQNKEVLSVLMGRGGSFSDTDNNVLLPESRKWIETNMRLGARGMPPERQGK